MLDNDSWMGPESTDATMIERSLLDPDLFGAIFDRHFTEVHGYLSRRAGSDNADGLVGDVFRIAFENRSRYRTERSCALPWLYGIAANVLRQHRRSEHRRLRLVDKLTIQGAGTNGAGDELARSRTRDEVEMVVSVLGALPEPECEAVMLYAWEDLSYEEIAIAQDVPVGTVRSRLNRARRRIRERIGGSGQEGDEPIRRAVRRCET
ncbi:MAG: RNA polymerase sigma factor [Acidimicrobiales bacterium]|nr:RNA polymerase sigma factor [Acidimicrobiales bacterium]